MQVNNESYKKVVEYVKNHSDYTFEKFIIDNHLATELKWQQDNILIPCPFHEDASPSFSVNDNKGVCHCMSCGRKGNYIKFRTMYSNELNGTNFTEYQMANSLLINDPIMQATLSIHTIFTAEKEFVLRDHYELNKVKPLKANLGPSSYSEAVSRLKKQSIDFSSDITKIKTFILMMCDGVPPEKIWSEFTGEQVAQYKDNNNNKVNESEAFDVSDLILEV